MENQTTEFNKPGLEREKKMAELMKGMTYKEWKVFSRAVDGIFDREVKAQSKTIEFSTPHNFEQICESYFWTI